jgi:poly-beta-1,6-N-acetyl-D-glucosamine synthase
MNIEFSWLLWIPHLFYLILVLRMTQAFRTISTESESKNQDQKETPDGITVILPLRNEEESLPAVLSSLIAQNLDKSRWQLIAVNDQSTDGSSEILSSATAEFLKNGFDFSVLHTIASAQGKKAAIMTAIKQAKFETVIVLDADSIVSHDWLADILNSYSPDTGMVCGAAVFDSNGTIFGNVVQLEYAGLLSAGLASVQMGTPFYASGANLSYRLQAFYAAGGFDGIDHIRSGDDTLLIQRINTRTNWKIRTTLSPGSLVKTRAPDNLAVFIKQRIRWSSTEFDFPDKKALVASIMLYLVFFLSLLLPLLALLNVIPEYFLLMPLAKIIPDFLIVRLAAKRMNLDHLQIYFPLVWIFQLFYSLIIPWFGTFASFSWREVK